MCQWALFVLSKKQRVMRILDMDGNTLFGAGLC